MTRYIRLVRALGWSWHDLDAALDTFDGTSHAADDGPGIDLVARLVKVGLLSRELRLPLPRVLGFFGDLDTHQAPDGTASTYENLFANPSLTRHCDAAAGQIGKLRQVADGSSVLVGAGETITGNLAAVCAALTSVLTSWSPSGRPVARHAARPRCHVPCDGAGRADCGEPAASPGSSRAMARRLRLGVAEWRGLVEVTSVDPYADPTHLRAMRDLVADLRRWRLTVADLTWLVIGERGEDSKVALGSDRIGQLTANLRQGLAKFNTGGEPFPGTAADDADTYLVQTLAGTLISIRNCCASC